MNAQRTENETYAPGASANAGAQAHGYRTWDKLAIVLAALLIAALGAASLYGFTYAELSGAWVTYFSQPSTSQALAGKPPFPHHGYSAPVLGSPHD